MITILSIKQGTIVRGAFYLSEWCGSSDKQ